MKSEYNEKLMLKYGIDESDAEIISELKRRIRKISPLTREQKEGCEVCGVPSKKETIYNHHIMKVEYLAIIAYYYDLYKKEKNPNYVENRGTTPEEINTQSEKEYIYVLKKDLDLYIPRIAICERHHNMLHELAGDFEGSTNKNVLSSAKPKELKYLFETIAGYDRDIYEHIFEKDDSLDGREYYVSYLKIWNDTVQITMDNLLTQIDKRLNNDEEIGKKNVSLLMDVKEKAIDKRDGAKDALDDLNKEFGTLGMNDEELNVEEFEEEQIEEKEFTDEEALRMMRIDELEEIYSKLNDVKVENEMLDEIINREEEQMDLIF